MTVSIRQLVPGDELVLEDFLGLHRDSSMFLRANARRVGLLDEGQPYQATYAAAFRGQQLVGVAAHCWNGMILIQAPEHAAEVARACVALSRRSIRGLSGPTEPVRHARAALGLVNAHTAMEEDEGLYALSLSDIIAPAALADGTIVCRMPNPSERDLLCDWRLAYDIETLGSTDTAETRHRSAAFLDAQIADGNAWIALHAGAPVSLSAFNAALPDVVQLGGIYTPPEWRGRGFAKAAVAASLLTARERGVSRGVLFTSNPSAVRTYEAVGFRQVGSYGLVLLS
jgi:GNAT superfamily N-acetyltransferase